MSDIVGPKSEFQEKILNSNARIMVIGGAAGSSKSYIGLMRHLRWADDPLYRGYCIRKNSTAIMKSGGLFEQAVGLYGKVYPKIKIKIKDQKIVFPSGASVTFSHYENDSAAQMYQGLQLSNVFYDEATHASEEHIWWLISRLRTDANLDPSIWLSCNPDPDSFLYNWVKWWLYPEGHEKFGLPDPEKNGIVRWVLRVEGNIVWGDSREELMQKYAKKHLSMDDPRQVRPLSFQVLLGTVFDNPTLIENQPEYVSNLESLPDIERRRLLLGDWNARQLNSTYFNRSWVEEISQITNKIVSTVRAFDFAGTLVSDTNPSPDYTVSARMRKLDNGMYVLDDLRRIRIRFGDWDQFVFDCAKHDPPNTQYVIPLDPGVAAERATREQVKRLIEAGLIVKTLKTNKSKLERFRPFSAMAQNGNVQVLAGCGIDYENNILNDNQFFYKELEAFTGERKRGESGHDDIPDAISDAFYQCAVGVTLPAMGGVLKKMADITKVVPYK
jgi:phage terminase large subunit-like protein